MIAVIKYHQNHDPASVVEAYAVLINPNRIIIGRNVIIIGLNECLKVSGKKERSSLFNSITLSWLPAF